MRKVTFIDTSVFTNILEVPGFCQDADEVKNEYAVRVLDEKFVLPITTIIETGNHVSQVKNGELRRDSAKKFSEAIKMVAENRAPFELNTVSWGNSFLLSVLSGAETGSTLIEHASNGVGTGDLSILAEANLFRSRTQGGIRVDVWTLDGGLSAYSTP